MKSKVREILPAVFSHWRILHPTGPGCLCFTKCQDPDPVARGRESRASEITGCWWIVASVATGDKWEHADSIGMCVYEDPLDPFQNCYVVDLMATALEAIPQPGEA